MWLKIIVPPLQSDCVIKWIRSPVTWNYIQAAPLQTSHSRSVWRYTQQDRHITKEAKSWQSWPPKQCLTLKIPKKAECPEKDPLTDGSILKMDEWESFTLYPNGERMDLLAAKIEKVTGVWPPYMTAFEDLAKNAANHTKPTNGFGLTTTFVINDHLLLPHIYPIIFGA